MGIQFTCKILTEMKSKALFCLMAAVLTSVSCLKENNRSYATADKYFTDAVHLQTGVNGCYNPLRTIMCTRGFWEMSEVSCDLMYFSSANAYNSNCDVSPSRPAVGTTIWQNGYAGVKNCNEMMEDIAVALSKGKIKDKEAAPLFAETVVVRAMYYYLLTCTFGNVPFYTEKVTEKNRAAIATLPRMDAFATRDYLIDEIKEWIVTRKALPYVRTYDSGTEYRMGAAVGLMLAAKMCLWNERWDDAISFIDELESIYGNYADTPELFGEDYPLSDIPFKNKYTKESILEVGTVAEPYGIQSTGLIASITTPPRKALPEEGAPESEEEEEEESMVKSDEGIDFYAGIQIPALGGYSRVSSSCRPTSYFYKQLMPYSSRDLRTGEYSAGANEPRGSSGNLAWRWYGFGAVSITKDSDGKVIDVVWDTRVNWFRTSGNSQTLMTSTSRPWLGNKFWAEGMYNSKDPNNYKYFRFADALLMKSEALLKRGDYEDACKYLSITRRRANLSALTFANVYSNPEALMEEIRKERAKELFGEFQRKFDLVRWGIWYERTNNYNEGTYIHDYIRPCHRYWPIPAEQVSYSGNALDNNEYTAQ